MARQPPSTCHHPDRACLNQHELIRKYRCADCGAVMMCACDEVRGHRFLPHQLSEGCELDTQERVPVTHGFQEGVCSECRGLPADPAPAAAIHGRTSKIRRYYWRELFFAKEAALHDWDSEHPDATHDERRSAQSAIEKAVLQDIKELHASAPKYAFTEKSQAEVIDQYSVEVEPLQATYAKVGRKGAQIVVGDEIISAEEFALRHYSGQGWQVLQLESVPFHALFGVMMWIVIQDPIDPKNRIVSFGDRTAYEERRTKEPIWTHLPSDFGSAGYGIRRATAIEKHFDEFLHDDDLEWLFDYWRFHSENLRQYLWAHRPEDVERARKLLEILPPQTIKAILHYLVQDYWGRYLGWPDLLLHREGEFRFVEVKSSSDRLSDDQKRWIADNHNVLKLPFSIAKIHRIASQA
ncbi:VRR-NUC domain-containing protein [Pacificimonas sp. ICDLI1SI03]